jgi:tetratricopeptide (TPR) repeat protein
VTVELEISQADVPHLHMNTGPPPTDPYFAFDRAQQFRTLGQVDNAIETLSSAVVRVDDDQMVALQIELMMEAQRYDEVEQLLRPLQIERPNDADILMALAAVSSQKGKNYEAIRYYERIRLVTNEETTAVLNPLASAYFGDGNLVKARQMLELSLQVDPDQPEVRRLLDDVLGKGQGGSR